MSTNSPKLSMREAGLVDLHDHEEIEYWLKIFDCTHSDLIEAVRRVGTSARAIRQYLRLQRTV